MLHVGLYQPFLREIKKIYSSITKNVKQSPIFAARASYRIIFVLSCVFLLLSRIVLCCTRVV